MYLYLTIGAVAISVIVALLFVAKRWGASQERRKRAEQDMGEMADDAKIASKPFVSSPFGRMRGKPK